MRVLIVKFRRKCGRCGTMIERGEEATITADRYRGRVEGITRKSWTLRHKACGDIHPILKPDRPFPWQRQ